MNRNEIALVENAIDCLGNNCHGNYMPFFYTESNFLPENSVGYLIKRAFRYSTEALGPAFDQEGLTFSQWQALITLHFERARTSAELAKELAHDQGAMTRMVDAMEERGWVERNRDPSDRRCIALTITPAGRAVMLSARRRIIACWNEWLSDWEPAEVETLIASLQRLERTLKTAAMERACA